MFPPSLSRATLAGALLFAGGLASPAMQGARTSGLDSVADPARWRAVESVTPAARTARAGGVEFQCPFARTGADRFYWDHRVSVSLSPGMAMEIDITVPHPEAFRSLSIYLESGNGWYVATPRMQRPGRARLTLSPAQCTVEGRPAGWNRITRLRLSAWRGQEKDSSVSLHGLSLVAPPICIVEGTRSVPSGERRLSEDAANRHSEWLNTMRVPHAVVTEEEADHGALSRARLAILPYNSELPDATRRQLFSLLDRGGKLVVCFSADARLAERMGVELGSWKKAERPMQWCAFRFVEGIGWQGPSRVLQQSGSLMPVKPRSRGARVMAWWEDERGQRSPEAAWVESDAGAWMSHILLADDASTKPHLAAALAARYVPQLWPLIAASVMDSAGRIDSFGSTDEAMQMIARSTAPGAAGESARQALRQSEEERGRMNTAYQQKDYATVLRHAAALRSRLTEAYARVQSPAAGEFRGVWDHSGVGLFPGDWPRTASLLRSHGINAVFANLAWGGLAHYPSQVLPSSYSHKSNGDQAAQFVRAAHAQGLQAHAWIVCANLGEAPKAFVERMRKEGRTAQGPDGKASSWLNLAHPANQDLIVAVVRELASHYELDGIHLDYIRYPGSLYDCSPWTRAEFARARGRPVARWPGDVLPGGACAAEFQQWRVERINALVKRVRAELKRIRPEAKLSAAVYAEYPDCMSTVGQDWAQWIREGWVDFVCPMTYTENLARFSSDVARHQRVKGVQGRVYPGIGVTANESRLMPDQTIEQILAARSAGARGFVLFSLGTELRDATLPVLRLGPTRTDGPEVR